MEWDGDVNVPLREKKMDLQLPKAEQLLENILMIFYQNVLKEHVFLPLSYFFLLW